MKHIELRHGCLGFKELLAQNIAVISPTMTAALIVPVMYGTSGSLSWLSYAVGAVMLLMVALNLNVFAKKSAGTGSMYAYITRGLGVTAGGIGGWSLIWAYLGIAIAGVTGFSVFADKLLGLVFGISIYSPALFFLAAFLAWYIAWKDIHLSQSMTLIVEGLSVTLITILCLIVLKDHRFAVDNTQFNFKNMNFSSLALGVIIAIFSLVGFESATALGDEAKAPLQNIPKAIIWSIAMAGIFFVFVTYVTIIGTAGYHEPLADLDAPLNVMARLAHVGYLQIPISVGAMFSFFALALSCINAGSRIIFAMSRHELVHKSVSVVHEKNATPHVAINIMAVLAVFIPTAMYIFHNSAFTTFGWAGTMAAFGFLVAYILVTVSAPLYVHKRNKSKSKDWFISGIALLMLLVPAVGLVYPVPPPPTNYFVYIFVVYLAGGAAWISFTHRNKPHVKPNIHRDLEVSHAKFETDS